MTLGFNLGEDFVTPKVLEVIKKSRTQVDLSNFVNFLHFGLRMERFEMA